MYGCPLTIYLLTGFLGIDIPLNAMPRHLWATLLGYGMIGRTPEQDTEAKEEGQQKRKPGIGTESSNGDQLASAPPYRRAAGWKFGIGRGQRFFREYGAMSPEVRARLRRLAKAMDDGCPPRSYYR